MGSFIVLNDEETPNFKSIRHTVQRISLFVTILLASGIRTDFKLVHATKSETIEILQIVLHLMKFSMVAAILVLGLMRGPKSFKL